MDMMNMIANAKITDCEGLLEPFGRRLARIDGASMLLGHSPKNLGPDQRVPVMARATWESDRN